MLSSCYAFASGQTAGQDDPFERLTFINGMQHILRGAPRDLTADEVAMLHRALPHSVAYPDTEPVGWRRPNEQQQEHAGAGGRRRNVVHSVVLIYLYWLSIFATWLGAVGLEVGRKVVEAERRHAYIQRLLVEAYRLSCITVRKLHEWSEFWPCQILLQVLKYVGVGVLGAFLEIWEKRVMGDRGTVGNITTVQEVEAAGDSLVPLGEGDILSVTSQQRGKEMPGTVVIGVHQERV